MHCAMAVHSQSDPHTHTKNGFINIKTESNSERKQNNLWVALSNKRKKNNSMHDEYHKTKLSTIHDEENEKW